MTARKRMRDLKPGELDFFTLPGFSELSKVDKGRFRAIHLSKRPDAYTVEEFLARRKHGCLAGVPRKTQNAWHAHRRNGGTLDFAEWLPTYAPKGSRKAESDELTDRDLAMIARNVAITKERIEAKLRRMCA